MCKLVIFRPSLVQNTCATSPKWDPWCNAYSNFTIGMIKLVLHSAMCTRLVDTHTSTDLSNWQSTQRSTVNSSLSLHHHWMTCASWNPIHAKWPTYCYVLGDAVHADFPFPFFSLVSDPNLSFFLSNKWSQLARYLVLTASSRPLELVVMLCVSDRCYSVWPLDGATWWRRSRRHVDRRTHTLLARSTLPFVKLNPVRLRSEARMVSACTKDGWITAEVIDQLITSGGGC
jgi:hypothetical protein